MNAFDQLVDILKLDYIDFNLLDARQYVHTTCHDTLKAIAKVNKYDFRFSGPYFFDIQAIQNELHWLLQNIFCSSLDKASNNACFLCIRHILLMALERLMCNDFLPCKFRQIWQLSTNILNQFFGELKNIFPEFLPPN